MQKALNASSSSSASCTFCTCSKVISGESSGKRKTARPLTGSSSRFSLTPQSYLSVVHRNGVATREAVSAAHRKPLTCHQAQKTRMIRTLPFCFLIVVTMEHAAACTCVSALATTARTEMADAARVFRGTVIETRRLPDHPDPDARVRWRFVITIRVNRIWKGPPTPTVTLYDLSPGTDCQGFGFEVGKEYLVYASEDSAKDLKINGRLFYAWTDLFAEGTPMLRPKSCSSTGLTSEKYVHHALDELGPGRAVPRGHPVKK